MCAQPWKINNVVLSPDVLGETRNTSKVFASLPFGVHVKAGALAIIDRL